MKRNLFIIIFLAFLPASVFSQAERADIRSGNKLYQRGKYPEAEVFYKKAEQKNAASYQAAFNMAGALYKQQRYEQAGAIYSRLAQDGSDPTAQANVFYNNGNTLMASRQADPAKLDQAIESYKSALRINPSDMQAKFNLAYAQKLKQEQQDKDKDKDKNQDQNKDNKDQNQDKNQQNQDQNQDNKDNKDKPKEQPQKPEPQQNQDTERMLNAVQNSEDNTKKKVEQQKAAAAGRSDGKNW